LTASLIVGTGLAEADALGTFDVMAEPGGERSVEE